MESFKSIDDKFEFGTSAYKNPFSRLLIVGAPILKDTFVETPIDPSQTPLTLATLATVMEDPVKLTLVTLLKFSKDPVDV